jgi:hypothetical protein
LLIAVVAAACASATRFSIAGITAELHEIHQSSDSWVLVV